MQVTEVFPFLGPITSIDERSIPDNAAADLLNVDVENGTITVRKGYAEVEATQHATLLAYGAHYTQGYNASYAQVEEYITFENVNSSNVKAYTRHVTTGVPTAITGATSLHASDWVGFAFDSDSYHINPNHSTTIYKHVIGDNTSWVALGVPANPTTALTVQAVFTGSGGTAYSQLSWAGLDPTLAGEMACTGLATNTGSALTSASEISVRHTGGSGGGAASFAPDFDDMDAGDQDWSYADAFAYTLTEDPGIVIDPASIVNTHTNEDGSPLSFTHHTKAQRHPTTPKVILVWVYAKPGKVRADHDNIGVWTVSYNVVSRSGTASNNDVVMSKPFVGCCFPFSLDPMTSAHLVPAFTVDFGYSYYFSTPTLESGIAGTVTFVCETGGGYNPLGGGPGPQENGLGSFLKFGITASADGNVDNARLYWFDNLPVYPGNATVDNVWRRIVTQNDATATYYLKANLQEMLALEPFKTITGFQTARAYNAFPFKGCVIWLYDQGSENVKFSRIGQPIKQRSDLDPEEDENKGATFTLADNAADRPLGGCQAGDAAVVMGASGAYASFGDKPFLMTPFRKLAGSFGCCNKFAFARYKNDSGEPGVAWVSKDGDGVYFARTLHQSDTDNPDNVVNLTDADRELVKTFLIDGQSSLGTRSELLALMRVGVDERQDALWVACGANAIVLRRGNVQDGNRYWHRYTFTLGTGVYIKYLAFSTQQRMRALLSSGRWIEFEWSSANNDWITGSLRDGGAAIASMYWQGKKRRGHNRRLLRAEIRRDTLTDTPSLQVVSDRETNTYTATSGKLHVRGKATQQGKEHQHKIVLAETDGPVTALSLYESPLSERLTS